MKTSDGIDKIAPALVQAIAAIPAAKRESDNPFFKSKYADLSGIIEVARKPLADNGLAVMGFPSASGDGSVALTLRVIHSSGQWIDADPLVIRPKDAGPQALGQAITYLRRYGTSSLLQIATEDDDGESAEGRGPAAAPRRPAAAPKAAAPAQRPPSPTVAPAQAPGGPTTRPYVLLTTPPPASPAPAPVNPGGAELAAPAGEPEVDFDPRGEYVPDPALPTTPIADLQPPAPPSGITAAQEDEFWSLSVGLQWSEGVAAGHLAACQGSAPLLERKLRNMRASLQPAAARAEARNEPPQAARMRWNGVVGWVSPKTTAEKAFVTLKPVAPETMPPGFCDPKYGSGMCFLAPREGDAPLPTLAKGDVCVVEGTFSPDSKKPGVLTFGGTLVRE